MRIDSIKIENFRGIDTLSLELDPRLTLLVGDNGSGKTSILSAVSVALGIWHLSDVLGDIQLRSIMDHEVREVPGPEEGGLRQFVPAGQVQISARGEIGSSRNIEWRRGKLRRGGRTVDEDSEEALRAIETLQVARELKEMPLPLLAYYGAGRAWLPSNERVLTDLDGDLKSRQADGYYDCLNERIRVKDVLKWFVIQAAARDNSGKFRPAFEAVRQALRSGIPGINDIYWDPDKSEIIVDIGGNPQPFSNLSDGQRSIATMIADLAIRAVTLNPHLLGDGNGSIHPGEVLAQTPGVVLIDEIDVHLHPEWQRSVVRDLLRTFPKVQFICTSHSPQVMGEIPVILNEEQVGRTLILDAGEPRSPSVHYADSNWILEHQMGPEVDSRNSRVQSLLSAAQNALINQELDRAESALNEAHGLMGGEDGQWTRLNSSLASLKRLKNANN